MRRQMRIAQATAKVGAAALAEAKATVEAGTCLDIS